MMVRLIVSFDDLTVEHAKDRRDTERCSAILGNIANNHRHHSTMKAGHKHTVFALQQLLFS
jgi:hypothetical protein